MKTEKNAPKKDFESLKRVFEIAYASGLDYGNEMMELCTAIAYSVVNVCIDPQRKTAPERETVSNSGLNPAMIELKRGINSDIRLLDNTSKASDKATKTEFNDDGEMVTETADKNAYDALSDMIQECLSDGIDLVQTAAVALLEQAAEHADGIGWLDKTYITYGLPKKVYIQRPDSAARKPVETTPMSEVYATVRRYINDSRAVQTDPRNGYTYIEDMTADGLDTIYLRMGKYSDIGGYARDKHEEDYIPGSPAGYGNSNSLYTADKQTADDIRELSKSLGLREHQEEILRLRLQGYGKKAIATYFNTTQHAVSKTLKQIQKKAEAIGLSTEQPKDTNNDTDN